MQLLIDSLNEDYEKLRIYHEQYYSKLNSCLSKYPGDQFVIEVVNSAKNIWIKDLELYNNTLRKESENVDKDAMVDLFIPVFVTNKHTYDELPHRKQVDEDNFDFSFHQDSADNDDTEDNVASPMLRKCSTSAISKCKRKEVEAISIGSNVGEKKNFKHTRQKKHFFQKTCVSLPIVDVKTNLTATDLELSESIFFAAASPQ